MHNAQAPAPTYIVFHPSDAALASRLRRWLRRFRVPRKLVGRPTATGAVPARLEPLLYPRTRSAGTASSPSIDLGPLKTAESLIVICSRESARCPVVNNLILAFKQSGHGDRTLCLIASGEPNASDRAETSSDECFAPALRYRIGTDGNLSAERAEPIAADMRPGKDGRRDAWLKIAAGVAGVGFDELKQRELTRRRRVIAVFAGIAAGVMVAAASLSIVALFKQRAAALQREAALASRQSAEAARHKAERALSAAEARRSAARAILDGQCNSLLAVNARQTGVTSIMGLRVRAADMLTILAEVPMRPTDPSPPFGKAATLMAVARSSSELREHSTAIKALENADAILMAHASDAPGDDSPWALMGAELRLQQAETHLAKGDLAEADASLARYRELAPTGGMMDSAIGLRASLVAADLELNRGNLDDASRLYRAMLETASADATSRDLMARVHEGLARVAMRGGDLSAASECLRRAAEAGDARRGSLHDLYADVAKKSAAAGDAPRAIGLLEESVALARQPSGELPVRLVPQLLSLAELLRARDDSQSRQCRHEAMATCTTHLLRLWDPDTMEHWLPSFKRQMDEGLDVMMSSFLPALQAIAGAGRLEPESLPLLESSLQVVQRLPEYLDAVVARVKESAKDSPDYKTVVADLARGRAIAGKIKSTLEPQVLQCFTHIDDMPPPPAPTERPDPPGTVTNSIGMRLVPIAAGEFRMGSPGDEPDAATAEEHPHVVLISRPFLIGMHEVTQAQFSRVMDRNPSQFRGDALPVEHLSWHDATAFCIALGDMPEERAAGRRYRLPTEAEWEYCCRAGTTTAFNTGSHLAFRQARFAVSPRGRPKPTAPIGTYPPNAWGLHDMHGNVWEWTGDWFSATYYKSSPRMIDPTGPATGTHHVLRGGSASVLAHECRSAARGEAPADTPDDSGGSSRYALYGDFGLRVVCDIGLSKAVATPEHAP